MIIRNTSQSALKLVYSISSLMHTSPYSPEFFAKESLGAVDKQYIEYSLMKGEEIFYKSNLHWRVMLWPLVLSTLLLAEPFVLVISSMWLIIALADQITSEFVITNKRLSMQTGIVIKRTFEACVEEIQDIDVKQGALGRVLGYGTMVVIGPDGSRSRFPLVSKPFEFKERIQEQIQSRLIT